MFKGTGNMLGQHVSEPGLRIDVVHLAGFDHPSAIFARRLRIFLTGSTTAICTGAKQGTTRPAVRACRRQVTPRSPQRHSGAQPFRQDGARRMRTFIEGFDSLDLKQSKALLE
jgi:hypothetical protein